MVPNLQEIVIAPGGELVDTPVVGIDGDVVAAGLVWHAFGRGVLEHEDGSLVGLFQLFGGGIDLTATATVTRSA